MLKAMAILFGMILLSFGIAGFVPQANEGDYLLGFFRVNLFYNLLHLLTGIVGISRGLTTNNGARIFFKIFGSIYGVLAISGFYYMENNIGGLIANNLSDTYLHLLFAFFSLYLGFFYPAGLLKKSTPETF